MNPLFQYAMGFLVGGMSVWHLKPALSNWGVRKILSLEKRMKQVQAQQALKENVLAHKVALQTRKLTAVDAKII